MKHPFYIYFNKIKLLFASDEESDFINASRIFDLSAIDYSEKDLLIEELNTSFPRWHYFMLNGRIKRVRSHKK